MGIGKFGIKIRLLNGDIMGILKFLKRFRCNHEFVTTSNFYGDYINYISSGFPVYRSRQKCIKCGMERLSEYLDKDCKVINDGTVFTYEIPEPTDEEIKDFFKANGMPDVNPEDVRQYIRESLYKLYCEAVNKNRGK